MQFRNAAEVALRLRVLKNSGFGAVFGVRFIVAADISVPPRRNAEAVSFS